MTSDEPQKLGTLNLKSLSSGSEEYYFYYSCITIRDSVSENKTFSNVFLNARSESFKTITPENTKYNSIPNVYNLKPQILGLGYNLLGIGSPFRLSRHESVFKRFKRFSVQNMSEYVEYSINTGPSKHE